MKKSKQTIQEVKSDLIMAQENHKRYQRDLMYAKEDYAKALKHLLIARKAINENAKRIHALKLQYKNKQRENAKL